jgi:hypothetical protein
MNCPRCNSDNVRSLQLIHEIATSDVGATNLATMVGVGLNANYSGSGGLFGRSQWIQQVNAAKQAAPPAQKDYEEPAGVVLLGIGALVWSWYAFSLWSILLFLIGIFLLVEGVRIAAEVNQWNREEWPKLHERWLLSFRCLECGLVFEYSAAWGTWEQFDFSLNQNFHTSHLAKSA